MLEGFALLLFFQLVGELITRLLSIPVPGPVIGMALLLPVLLFMQRVPDGLRQVAEGLLKFLPLLYVPAGVGLINHGELLLNDAWVIGLVLVVGTLITLVATTLAHSFFTKLLVKPASKPKS